MEIFPFRETLSWFRRLGFLFLGLLIASHISFAQSKKSGKKSNSKNNNAPQILTSDLSRTQSVRAENIPTTFTILDSDKIIEVRINGDKIPIKPDNMVIIQRNFIIDQVEVLIEIEATDIKGNTREKSFLVIKQEPPFFPKPYNPATGPEKDHPANVAQLTEVPGGAEPRPLPALPDHPAFEDKPLDYRTITDAPGPPATDKPVKPPSLASMAKGLPDPPPPEFGRPKWAAWTSGFLIVASGSYFLKAARFAEEALATADDARAANDPLLFDQAEKDMEQAKEAFVRSVVLGMMGTGFLSYFLTADGKELDDLAHNGPPPLLVGLAPMTGAGATRSSLGLSVHLRW